MKRVTLRALFRTVSSVAVATLVAVPASAQLTVEQKIHDFENIAAVYAKRYAPYEWKKELFGFDLFDIGPWLDRVARSSDDLEFFEIALEYVASLNDTHSSFAMPSSFLADLGFTVDIYDGKVLIDSINRTRLPAFQYPFEIGDQLISVDGRSVDDLMDEFSRFLKRGSPLSARRTVADLLTFRPQSRIPRAIDLPDAAIVVIERFGGAQQAFFIPWVKTGVPLRWIGPVPSPPMLATVATAAALVRQFSGAASMTAAVAVPVKMPADSPDKTRPTNNIDTEWATRNTAALATANTTPASNTGRRPIASDHRPNANNANSTPPAYVA